MKIILTSTQLLLNSRFNLLSVLLFILFYNKLVLSQERTALPRHLLQINWNKDLSTEYAEKEIISRYIFFQDKSYMLPKKYFLVHPFIGTDSAKSKLAITAENAQRFVEYLISNIVFNSPTGNELAFKLTGGHAYLVEKFLGYNLFNSRKIAPLIKPNLRESEKKYKKMTANSMFNHPPNIYRFELIYTKEKTKFNSWTNLLDMTSIFITPDLLSANCSHCDEHLYRVFIHELALSADGKADLMSFTKFQKNYQGPDACLAYAVLEHPKIRLAFSTLRAYQVEEQILSELGFKTINKNNLLKNSCSALLLKNLRQNQSSYEIINSKENKLMEENIYSTQIRKLNQEKLSTNNCNVNLKGLTIKDAIKILENDRFLKDNHKLVTLCESELELQFTSPVHKLILSRGPRPRVGDGSGYSDENKILNEPL